MNEEPGVGSVSAVLGAETVNCLHSRDDSHGPACAPLRASASLRSHCPRPARRDWVLVAGFELRWSLAAAMAVSQTRAAMATLVCEGFDALPSAAGGRARAASRNAPAATATATATATVVL